MTNLDARNSYLGIDAGGSKTAWVVWRDGEPVDAGVTQPIQVTQLGAAAAAQALAGVLAAVSARWALRCAAAGLAGAGSPAVRGELREGLRRAGVTVRVHLAGDPEIAAASALATAPGIAVWSGTGSFAIARDARGELHRVGGRGWLLGDQGSGFDLARRGAAAAVAALDGLGPMTALGALLCARLGLREERELGRTLQSLPPHAVAALYPEVRSAAEGGDAVAQRIRNDGAEALAALVGAAAVRARLAPAPAVWCGGGLLQRDPRLRAALERALLPRGFPALHLCSDSAALGAARLAAAVDRGEAPLCGWLPADGLDHGSA